MTKRRLWVVEVWSGKSWVPCWSSRLTRLGARNLVRGEREHTGGRRRFRVVSYEPSRSLKASRKARDTVIQVGPEVINLDPKKGLRRKEPSR